MQDNEEGTKKSRFASKDGQQHGTSDQLAGADSAIAELFPNCKLMKGNQIWPQDERSTLIRSTGTVFFADITNFSEFNARVNFWNPCRFSQHLCRLLSQQPPGPVRVSLRKYFTCYNQVIPIGVPGQQS